MLLIFKVKKSSLDLDLYAGFYALPAGVLSTLSVDLAMVCCAVENDTILLGDWDPMHER